MLMRECIVKFANLSRIDSTQSLTLSANSGMRLNFAIFLASFSLLVSSCQPAKKLSTSQKDAGISSLRFIGERDIPYALTYNNTTVGGLSGIDYNSAEDHYYLICDDRSAINPARYYSMKIRISPNGIDTLYFTAEHPLLQPGGTTYPNSRQNPANTPDPESMRYNSRKKQLVWTSEGERIVREKDTVLSDPAIRIIDTAGNFIDSLVVPQNMRMQGIEKGPRQNGVFEGMSFSDDFKTMFVSVEEPLFEDGPRADTFDNNAYIRILKFDTETKRNTGQYAYKLDPVAYPANPPSGFKINGVPDILSLGNNRLMVIERSFSTGRLACTIKIFIADLSAASDITNNPSIRDRKNFSSATKTLLLNMDELGIYTDNIEGVTFGPLLPNGHRTLLFVADNNFSPIEKSQVLLFEVIE